MKNNLFNGFHFLISFSMYLLCTKTLFRNFQDISLVHWIFKEGFP